MGVRGYTAFIAWAFFVIALGPSGASAQEQCTNAQSVGCDYDPNYGWIKRGSAPPSSSSDSGYQEPAPVNQAELEESTRRYQEEMRQADIAAQLAAEDRARAEELNRTATADQRGTCRYWPSGGDPFPPEIQLRELRNYEDECLQLHHATYCMGASNSHSQFTIPEANPRMAYRFMKLSCDYGYADACEMVQTQCIPE